MWLCVDIDENKIAMLKEGKVPIYEPGLEEMVRRNAEKQRLSLYDGFARRAVKHAAIIFIAVGTPQGPTGHANLGIRSRLRHRVSPRRWTRYKIIVTKSTVPVGTADQIKQWIAEEYCPAFCRDVQS